jgi:hypothetical protein
MNQAKFKHSLTIEEKVEMLIQKYKDAKAYNDTNIQILKGIKDLSRISEIKKLNEITQIFIEDLESIININHI